MRSLSREMTQSLELVAGAVIRPVSGVGAYMIFLWESVRRFFWPPINMRLLMRQMEFVGNRSFWIMVLAGTMVGAVFGLQFGEIFRIFGAEGMIGAAAAFALSKELAPVVGSFLVTARAGSSMAAEIATMRVNEQIDAMRVMSVNPYGWLVAPRILGSVLMMPLLTCVFTLSGVIAAWGIGVALYDVDVGMFFDKIRWIVEPNHVFQGMQKAAIFGAIFSSVGCYKGFHARGGAKGVGRATTAAVVISLVAILISDFFISWLQFEKAL
jgi:phospholipid/cholesterol/gamma-HCH transport system permease protein